MAVSAWFGARVLTRWRAFDETNRDDFGTILAATLTLLGLIIGFTFSMAITRYDQRKNLEEEEANAIGTEYVRADLLPAAAAARVRSLLKEYVDVRTQFYMTRDTGQLGEIAAHRAKLQSDLKDRGIPSRVYYPSPLPQQTAYAKFPSVRTPATNALCDEVVSLPMHPYLSETDQDRIIEGVLQSIA